MRQLKGAESLERASFLDRAIDPVRRVVAKVQRGRWGDVLHGVWLGHPAHPVFVQLPIGAWASSAVLDTLPGYDRAARRLIAVGIVSALPAALTGAADWSQQNRRQLRVGAVHAVANGAALVLYSASLFARSKGCPRAGSLLSCGGLTAVGVGGFLGGHIAYRQLGGVNRAEGVFRSFPREWHVVCSLDALPERQLTRHSVGGFDVLLVRLRENVNALVDTCTHLAGPLSEGTLVYEGDGADSGDACVRCPLHGSTFRLRDGGVAHGPATAPQPTLLTRVREGRVEVRARDG